MPGEAIDRLIEANLRLWHLEDERRDHTLSDERRLKAADAVSEWNRKRNQAIDEINRILSERLPSSDSEGTGGPGILLTGSLGDLIDRLAIARIRHYHLSENPVDTDATKIEHVTSEIQDLKQQIREAVQAASNMTRADRQRLFGFGKNKSYKNEGT